MNRMNDPIENTFAKLPDVINGLSEENRADFRATRSSKTLPYTIGFVVAAVALFLIFAAVVRP